MAISLTQLPKHCYENMLGSTLSSPLSSRTKPLLQNATVGGSVAPNKSSSPKPPSTKNNGSNLTVLPEPNTPATTRPQPMPNAASCDQPSIALRNNPYPAQPSTTRFCSTTRAVSTFKGYRATNLRALSTPPHWNHLDHRHLYQVFIGSRQHLSINLLIYELLLLHFTLRPQFELLYILIILGRLRLLEIHRISKRVAMEKETIQAT